MIVQSLWILGGLVLLVGGGNALLKGAVDLSLRLAIPKIIVGMTVVSFATSAPELIVSARAALDGHPDLALGNVLGSNMANLGLVLSVTLLLGSIDVRPAFYRTDWPMLMFTSLLLYAFLRGDGTLVAAEGWAMLVLLLLFLAYLLRFQKPAVAKAAPAAPSGLPLYQTVLYLGLGGAGLWGGSEMLIHGATDLAQSLGVGERVIAITVVSVGTSVPELAASVIAMLRKEKALSLGNLIGSNIFNILAVLGITAVLTPVHAEDPDLLSRDLPWMLGISFLILPLVFIPKGLRLGWRDGLVLLVCYAAFVYFGLQ